MNSKNFIILIILIIFQSNTLISEWKLSAPSSLVYKVQSISCPDSNNCFALIDHPSTPVLYKSTDQGSSWFLIYENDIKRYPALVEGVSPDAKNYFFIEDTYLNLWKSNDSGYTFQLIQIGSGFVKLSNLSMWGSLIGFVTDKYSYYTTTDGWETFVRHPKKNNLETFYSPQFIDSNTIIMAYASSDNPKGMAVVKYYFQEDKWDTLSYLGFNSGSDQTANDFNRIYCQYFVNDSLGFGSGSSRVHQGEKEYFDMVYKTTDGGNTWETVLRDLYYPEVGLDYDISFADEMNGIAVGFYGKIAMTNDGGDTWTYEPLPNDMDNCRKMLVCWAGQTPLIGTWDAGIFRYEGDFFDFPISVKDKQEEKEISIYPNPACEYIEIPIPQSINPRVNPWVEGNSNIQIYNIYGECMTHLTPALLCVEVVRFDVSTLCAGIYFLRFGDRITKFIKY